jgi:hypothetical protein
MKAGKKSSQGNDASVGHHPGDEESISREDGPSVPSPGSKNRVVAMGN